MDKIKKFKDRLFSKFKKNADNTYKDVIYSAVKARNIEKLTESLQELECINPEEAVSFLQDILIYLANNSEGHKDRIDIFDDLQDTIDIMMNNYDKDFPVEDKESETRAKKLENIKSNFRMLKPHILENEQKVQKNEQIQDILKTALERFLQCRQPYPEILPTIFMTIKKRDVDALTLIIDNIDSKTENRRYLVEQIRTSYTVENLKNEIKCLKSNESTSKDCKKHKSLLDVDIRVWNLLKGLEIRTSPTLETKDMKSVDRTL